MLSENLKEIRKKNSISLRKLSSISGVSKTTISDIENNKINPSIETTKKLAEALKIPIKQLIDEPTDNLSDIIKSKENIEIKETLSNLLYYAGFHLLYKVFPRNDEESHDEVLMGLINNNIPVYEIYKDGVFITNLYHKDVEALLSNIKNLIEFEIFKASKKEGE